MFAALKDALTKAFSKTDNDIVYFGGFEESTVGQNEPAFSLYYPSKQGLIYLPYTVCDEEALEQLQAMEVGEAFHILEEEESFDIGGTVKKIERIIPAKIIRIEGEPTNHPEAPFHPVLKLFS